MYSASEYIVTVFQYLAYPNQKMKNVHEYDHLYGKTKITFPCVCQMYTCLNKQKYE